MIVIMNISEEKGIPYLAHGKSGKQIYRVQLNNIPLCEFEHYTEDCMSMCVEKAAIALSKIDIDQKISEYHTKQIYKLMEAGEGLGYE